MNIFKEIEGVLNSDLAKMFIDSNKKQVVTPSVATVTNPIQEKKDYTTWIVGAVVVVSVVAVSIFAFKK